jgi:hypothetical protein
VEKRIKSEEADARAFELVTAMEHQMEERPVDRIIGIMIGQHRLIKSEFGGLYRNMLT